MKMPKTNKKKTLQFTQVQMFKVTQIPYYHVFRHFEVFKVQMFKATLIPYSGVSRHRSLQYIAKKKKTNHLNAYIVRI